MLIPPGSDVSSTLDMSSMQNRSNVQGVIDTLPQSQSAEEHWYRAGPEFQHEQTRFLTYDNTFDAGVVLQRFTGPGPYSEDFYK